MENPRPDKVAVVEDVKQRFADADAVLLTDYRGLSVGRIAELRRSLTPAGADYKIYKNTLVRLATNEAGLDLDDLLVGPTALAFVNTKEDGSPGDPAAVAKALRDFAKDNKSLVVKGGVLADKTLSADDINALAELPSREVLLAQLAGAFQAPLTKLAGLLQALPRNFAYGLSALIEKGGAPGAPAAEPVADEAVTAEAPVEEEVASEDAAIEDAVTEEAAPEEAAPEEAAAEETTIDPEEEN